MTIAQTKSPTSSEKFETTAENLKNTAVLENILITRERRTSNGLDRYCLPFWGKKPDIIIVIATITRKTFKRERTIVMHRPSVSLQLMN